jgi:beta-N-acetylhexosaminidase
MPEAAIRSLEAGCDILLVGRGDFPASYEKVLAAVKEGRISMPRLDESVKRILALKEAADLLGPARESKLAFEQVGGSTHQDLAGRIADASITLLRNDESLLPLQLPKNKTLVVVMFRGSHFSAEMAGFLDELRRRHQRTRLIELAPQPDARTLGDAAKAAGEGDVLLFGTYQIETMDNKSQADFYRKLRTLGKPMIVASLMNPYDLRSFTEAKTRLCTYGITPASLHALARVIFGEITPRGKLPVSIPGSHKRGDGLEGY